MIPVNKIGKFYSGKLSIQIKKFCYICKAFLCFILIGVICNGRPSLASERLIHVSSIKEMRQKNVVLQNWDLSCAAAALATVMRYQFGVPVTERSVALGLINRKEYIANPYLVRQRQGFSLLDMKRYVDSLGYEGIGLGDLILSDIYIRAPIIVPVNLQGYPHFVIFRGGTDKTVLIADPAFGNVTMSVEKFLKGWIKYKDLGRVGFMVTIDGKTVSAGKLSAGASEFLIMR